MRMKEYFLSWGGDSRLLWVSSVVEKSWWMLSMGWV